MSYRTSTALVLAALAAFAPSRADACGPPLPGLTSSVPADGDTYPANAALFFSGFNIALTGVTVTVDGQPASFGPPPAKVPSVATLTATILPAPKQGQKVVIQGDFCAAPQQCPTKTISFTLGPPDTTAPMRTDAVAFDVYDYADYMSNGGDCTSSSDLALWVELKGATAAAGESPLLYTVEAFRDANLQDLALSRTGFITADDFRVEIRAFAKELGGKSAPDAFCFRATATDAAGNVTQSPSLACKACRYRVDNTPSMSQPAEPMWTSADIYPNGPCGMGSSSSSSSASSSSSGTGGGAPDACQVNTCGCQCRAGGEGEGEAAPAALAALTLVAGIMGRARRRARPGALSARHATAGQRPRSARSS